MKLLREVALACVLFSGSMAVLALAVYGIASVHVTSDMRRADVCKAAGAQRATLFIEQVMRERLPPLSAAASFSSRDTVWIGDCDFTMTARVAIKDGKPVDFVAHVHFDPDESAWHVGALTVDSPA